MIDDVTIAYEVCEPESRMQDRSEPYTVSHLTTASLVGHHKFTFVSVMSRQGALLVQMSGTGGAARSLRRGRPSSAMNDREKG